MNEIRTIALDIGLIPNFKNEDYTNSKQKLSFICKKHGEIFKTAEQIKGRHRCKYCVSEFTHEKQRYDYEFVKNSYLRNGFVLLEDTYVNIDKPNKCYCLKHPNIIQYKSFRMILDNRMCFYCQHEMQRKEGHPFWNGGITLLYNHLRTIIEPWKYDSSNYYNNRCILTNSYETVVHHLYKSFKSIVEESLKHHGINLKYIKISAIDKNVLQSIENHVLKLHYDYGYGIPLHKKIHNLFHELYGNKNNTPIQFEDFKTRLKLGEFNLFLKENNLKLSI